MNNSAFSGVDYIRLQNFFLKQSHFTKLSFLSQSFSLSTCESSFFFNKKNYIVIIFENVALEYWNALSLEHLSTENAIQALMNYQDWWCSWWSPGGSNAACLHDQLLCPRQSACPFVSLWGAVRCWRRRQVSVGGKKRAEEAGQWGTPCSRLDSWWTRLVKGAIIFAILKIQMQH